MTSRPGQARGLAEALSVALDYAEDTEELPPELCTRMVRELAKLKVAGPWFNDHFEMIRLVVSYGPGFSNSSYHLSAENAVVAVACMYGSRSGPDDVTWAAVRLSMGNPARIECEFEHTETRDPDMAYAPALPTPEEALTRAMAWVDAQLEAAGWVLMPQLPITVNGEGIP